MRIFQAPEPYQIQSDEISIFLAGGISGCPHWQKHVSEQLVDTDLVLLNPRRDNFTTDRKEIGYQIAWEHEALRAATKILFWFPCDTICPIVLYELGAWSMTDKPLILGIHPSYERRLDVEIQTALVRPDVEIHYSLKSLIAPLL